MDWSDKQAVLAAVRLRGYALQYASVAMKADKEVIMEAVTTCGLALQWASVALKADKEVVRVAILGQTPYALEYASVELQNDASLKRFPRIYRNLRLFWDWGMAHKRCKPALYAWLERAQIKLDAYGKDGAARKRDRLAFEADNVVG